MKRIFIAIFSGFIVAGFLAAFPVLAQWIGPTGTPPNTMPTSPEFIDFGLGAPELGTTTNPSIWIEDSGGGDLIRLLNTSWVDTLFVVGSDGNVGVQRIPGFKLDVGDVDAANEGDLNALRLCFDGDCRDDWIAAISSGGGGTAGYIAKWNVGGLLTDTVIFEFGTLIGINTVTPAFQLDVNGDFNANELCIVTVCRTSWSSLISNGNPATDNTFPKWTDSGTALTNTVSPVVDPGAGSVGFGANPPGAPLDVGGGFRLSGAGTNTIFGAEDDLFGVYQRSNASNSRAWIELWGGVGRVGELTLGGTDIALWGGSTTGGTGAQAMYLTSAGNLGIGLNPPGFQLDVANQFNADWLCLDGDCIDSWADLLSRLGPATPNALLKRDGSGSVVVSTVGPFIDPSGSVGIGPSGPNPLYRLNIDGDANATRWCIAGACIPNWASAGTDNQFLFNTITTPAGTAIADSATDTLAFTAPVGSGLLISGASTPDTITFNIDSSVVQDRVSSCPAGQAIRVISVDGTVSCISVGTGDADWTISGINQYSAVSGNVGIGAVSPAQKLHVSAGNNSFAIFGPNSSWSGYLYVGAGTSRTTTNRAQVLSTNGNLHLDAATNRDIYVNHYATTAQTYIMGGNVGVGDSTPVYKLDVAGDVQVQGWLRTTGSRGWYSQTYGGGWYMADPTWIRSYGSKPVYVNTTLRTDGELQAGSAGGRFVVKTNGRVGMGTTAPTYKLDVRGQVRIDQGSNYDVWIQGGAAGSGTGRNLALLGEKSTDRLRINYGGEYTGGTRIDGNLTVGGNITASAFYYSSDRSLKKNIRQLGSASSLDKVLKLNAVSFDWIDSGESSVGFIAQDVERVFPEVVVTDKVSGLKSVNYGVLTGPIVEAIKARQIKIDTLRSRIQVLETAINARK